MRNVPQTFVDSLFYGGIGFSLSHCSAWRALEWRPWCRKEGGSGKEGGVDDSGNHQPIYNQSIYRFTVRSAHHWPI